MAKKCVEKWETLNPYIDFKTHLIRLAFLCIGYKKYQEKRYLEGIEVSGAGLLQF